MIVLVVDDENSAIEAVLNHVRWEKLGITEIKTSRSVSEAVLIIEKEPVHILLSDIEMPGGTGLDLLTWVRENALDIQCIFMTCYADFSYVQQAMDLESIAYILKPLDFDILEKTLEKAVKKVALSIDIKEHGKYLERNQNLLVNKFWKDYFLGNFIYKDKEQLMEYAAKKKIPIDLGEMFCPMLVCVNKWADDSSRKDQQLMLYAMKNIMNELLDELEEKRAEIEITNDKLLIIFQVNPKKKEEPLMQLVKACERLVMLTREYYQGNICCYIGKVKGIEEIPLQLEKLQKMEVNNVVYEPNVYLIENEYTHKFNKKYNNRYFTKWDMLLSDNKFDDTCSEILEVLEKEKQNLTREFLMNFFQDYYQLLTSWAVKQDYRLTDIFTHDEIFGIMKAALKTYDDLVVWIKLTMKGLKDFTYNVQSNNNPVDIIKQYIERNISSEISMKELADYVHLHPDYLTRIFKKEAGMSISKYLLQRKMETAKNLMDHTEQSLGDISLKVGYLNYSSFHRAFMNTVGKSPQEYKLSQRKKE